MLKFEPTYTSTSDDHGVGNVFWTRDGKAYRWLQAVDLAWVVDNVVLPADTSCTTGTIDVAGGSAIGLRPLGIAKAATALSSYGFVQCAGVADVYTDGAVTVGQQLTQHASVNGQADTMADGLEELVFGTALETDGGSPTTSATLLQGLV